MQGLAAVVLITVRFDLSGIGLSRWYVILLFLMPVFAIETRKKKGKRNNKGQEGCILVSDKSLCVLLWPMGLSHTEKVASLKWKGEKRQRRRSVDGSEGARVCEWCCRKGGDVNCSCGMMFVLERFAVVGDVSGKIFRHDQK